MSTRGKIVLVSTLIGAICFIALIATQMPDVDETKVFIGSGYVSGSDLERENVELRAQLKIVTQTNQDLKQSIKSLIDEYNFYRATNKQDIATFEKDLNLSLSLYNECKQATVNLTTELNNLTLELNKSRTLSYEIQNQLQKIQQEPEIERIKKSQLQYTNVYVETEKDFIYNASQYTLSVPNTTAAITYVGYRVLHRDQSFELVSTPEPGVISGTVRMLQPTGKEETITFNSEHGYRAFARITNITSNKVMFEGFLYYRSFCFNPFRNALSASTEVTFTPIMDGKSTGSIERVSFSPRVNQFFDSTMISSLQEKNKKLQVLSLRKAGFTEKRPDELTNVVVLEKECVSALSWLFPLERLTIESVSITQTFVGRAYIVHANGEIDEKDLTGLQFIEVRTAGGRINKYLLTFPSLQLIIPKETYATFLENIKPFINAISANKKQIEKTGVNPKGKEFDLVPPKYLTGKTIAVFVGYNNTSEVVFSHKQRNWLEDQGLTVRATMNEAEFLNFLALQPALLWIISSDRAKTTSLMQIVDKVVELNKKGSALWLWADNTPYLNEANLVLQKITGDTTFGLTGNYYGTKTLTPNVGRNRGTFDAKHPVSTGLINLYEGVTISYPNKTFVEASGFQVYAYNSNPNDLQAAIFYKLPKANEVQGAVWVDTGFTKLFYQPQYDEETRRYLANVNAFLIGNKNL